MSFCVKSGFFGVALFALMSGVSAQSASPIEDQLKQDGSGVGRFRGGYYGALGWAQGLTKINDSATGGARLGGFDIEGGLYGLFNPIRDFADVEAGAGLKWVMPATRSGSSGNTSYYYGFYSISAYAGPVFRLNDSGSSLAVGGVIDIGNRISGVAGDPFLSNYKMKMRGTFGAYGEYQYNKPGSKQIYYTRLSYHKYDLSFGSAPSSISNQAKNQSYLTLSAGVKF